MSTDGCSGVSAVQLLLGFFSNTPNASLTSKTNVVMPGVISFSSLNRRPGRREGGVSFYMVHLLSAASMYSMPTPLPGSAVSPGSDLMCYCLDLFLFCFVFFVFVTLFQLKVASFLLYISYDIGKQGGCSCGFVLLDRCDYF